MLSEPTLLFYMDVPPMCVSWMLLNLQVLIDKMSCTELALEYCLFSTLIPTRPLLPGEDAMTLPVREQQWGAI